MRILNIITQEPGHRQYTFLPQDRHRISTRFQLPSGPSRGRTGQIGPPGNLWTSLNKQYVFVR